MSGKIVEFFGGFLSRKNAFKSEALEEIVEKIMYMTDTDPLVILLKDFINVLVDVRIKSEINNLALKTKRCSRFE